MSFLTKLYLKVADDTNKIGFDNQLVILSCIFAILTFFIGIIVNLILPLGNYIVIASISGLVLYTTLYFFARFKRYYTTIKIIFIVTLSIYMDVLWFANFGSTGPIIYIYIVAYTGFLFYLTGRQLKIFSIFFFFNTLGMFILEYYFPEYLDSYLNEPTRVIDVYTGLLIYLMIATLLIIYIKRGFIKERDKALHSEKLKSAFLANMSHEIRTPLNAILGFNQLLEKNVSEEKLKNYTKTIDQNGQHLLQIIDDILDISRIEAGELNISKTLIVAKELFEDIHFMLTKHYSHYIHTSAAISYSMLPENIAFFSDYTRIKQILLNLLTNSMKFTNSGEISFSCQLVDKTILFNVKDSGVGIDHKYQHLIFNRFRKLENEVGNTYSGTGIGLSITKELVDLLGGSIWFKSEKDKGTEFFFSIPFENPYSND